MIGYKKMRGNDGELGEMRDEGVGKVISGAVRKVGEVNVR